MACSNCCGQPPCLAPGFTCEGVAIYESKVRTPCPLFEEFVPSAEPKEYRTKTTESIYTHTGDYSFTSTDPESPFHVESSFSENESRTKVETCDDEEGQSCTETGTHTYEKSFSRDYGDAPETGDYSRTAVRTACDTEETVTSETGEDFDLPWDAGHSIGGIGGLPPVVSTTPTVRIREETNDFSDPLGGSGSVSSSALRRITETLSDPWEPETTEVLLARAAGLLEAADYEPGGCEAARHLDGDEDAITLSKARFRLTHWPTGTCYLKAWFKIITHLDGEEPTEEIVTKEWRGASTPCLPNPDVGFDWSEEQRLLGEWVEIAPPAENGSRWVELLKYTCVEGFEPEVGASPWPA